VIAATSWMVKASCRGCDPAMWWPERGSNAPEAKLVCRSCPVQIECLLHGLHEKDGVWGGLTALERKKVRREMNDMRRAAA
jgi:WhiB family transcriptional regulator, redox-sensing transcriptional regulator